MRLPLAALMIFLAMPAHGEPLSPVKTAELSARLYATGLELGDPLLILSAARLRKSLNPAASTRLPEGGAADTEAPLSWQDMLASAADMAEDDEILLGLIDDIQAESSKGVASGPVYNIGSLKNGGKDAYPAVEFVGGEYAEVYVEAKSATDLNLTIYDAQGRLVCSDTDASHIAYCGWRPADTSSFTMEVENQGPQGAKYALMTN
jgi:hypothetical protein